MKIQLDTTAKTIKLEDNVKLETLIKTLERLLPNKEWKQFTLQTNTIIEHWHSPTIIREIERQLVPYYFPKYPWIYNSNSYQGSATSNTDYSVGYDAGGKNKDFQLKAGIYNIEA